MILELIDGIESSCVDSDEEGFIKEYTKACLKDLNFSHYASVIFEIAKLMVRRKKFL